MPTLHLNDCLDNGYQHLRGKALANAPLEAIPGISDDGASALRYSLGVDTISKLANHPSILRAQAAAEAATTSLTPSQTAFYTMLAANVQSSLGSAIGGTFSPVSLPTGFLVYTQGGANNYYSQASLEALDGLLNPANNTPLLTFQDQTFSNMYTKMVNQGFWNLSTADAVIVNAPDVGQAQQLVWAATVQDNYPSLASAGWAAFITYTMTTYGVGQPMTPQGLSVAARNMALSYPNVSQSLTTYCNTQGPASAINMAQQAALAELNATQSSSASPSATNGGLQYGSSSYYVGYKVPVWTTLTAGLKGDSQVMVSMSASQFTSTSANLTIGTASSSADIGFFEVSFESSSSSYNFSSYTTSSSVVILNVLYTGCTIFGTTPTVLSTNNTAGWYDNTVLQQFSQTWNNTGSVTGFATSASTAYPPPVTFGVGKPFGQLKTWVISNPPEVSFSVTNANVSAMSAAFQEGTVVTNISLFSSSTGVSTSGYTVSSYEQSGSTVTVKLTPTPVPLLPATEQIAFVLGGVASYPPNNT